MRRYVMRGAKGIALIDVSRDKARLRYVFDVLDTGELENARRPQLWQYRPEHRQAVAKALENRYGISDTDGFASQLERISSLLAAQYWEDHQEDILGIIDGSFLEEYDTYSVREQFQSAAFISIAFALMSRCGLEPESYFQHEDFMSIFDFNTVQSAMALGAAVSQNSGQVLRQIEIAIKTYEREKRKERSAVHGEQTDIQPERGLLHPGLDVGGPAVPALGEVRENAPEISDGASSHPVGGTDGDRKAVPAPAGGRADSQRETDTDDAGVGEIGGSHGGTESPRTVEVGGVDEHLQGPGGGSDSGGAGVQLNSVSEEGQTSLFPSEQQQIEVIQETESVEAPSVSLVSDSDIDAVLRQGTGIQNGKLRIYEQYQKGISQSEAVNLLKTEYGIGGRSYTFSDGTNGHVDYRPAKGFEFWRTASGEKISVSWVRIEKRLRLLIQENNYLTPEELEKATPSVSKEPKALLRETTQADIDAALQEWNGDVASKRRVQQYMTSHTREKDTAAWLQNEYGDNLPAFPVTVEGAATDLPWSRVQRHIARLVKEDRFFTEAELEDFADIDIAAVREQLQQNQPSAFVGQVMADTAQLPPTPENTPTVREIFERYKPLMKDLVLADEAYRNACKNSDRETTVLEGDAAIKRAALTITEPEFMRLYYDMPDFRYRLHREIIDETYPILSQQEATDLSSSPNAHDDKPAQEIVGAGDLPLRDPLAPAYKVGDTVYLDKKPYIIENIYPSSVSLQDPSQTYPIFRSENKDHFESVLILDSRNGPITEFLPVNLETCDQDMREVLTSHLFTDKDKYYISGWFHKGEGNHAVAHRLSELFAGRAETIELSTGDKADYFTSTTSIEINILDNADNKKAVVTGFWSEVASLLRGLWLQELDGFAHEPPPLEPTHLEGTPSYAVGDKVVLPYHDKDISGTIGYIGENDIRIDTGPHAWNHQTVSKNFFEDALRQNERNAGLFVQEEPPEVRLPQEISAVGNFHISDDNLGAGGQRAKYRMNIEAIRTLKQIENEGRSATRAEQEILSRYVGWGGIPDAFDENKTAWRDEYNELKELLTPEEYKLAKASTLNAHYARFVP